MGVVRNGRDSFLRIGRMAGSGATPIGQRKLRNILEFVDEAKWMKKK